MNAIEPATALGLIADGLKSGHLIPYLGPGVLETGNADCPVPTTPRGLVERLTMKVGVPGRIRNNLWAAAQYIETHRHRVTLTRILEEIFAPVPEPSALQLWLADLPDLPLIVDTWYDGSLALALKGHANWGQVQGVTRHGETLDIYYRAFDSSGEEVPVEKANDWSTLVYKPHGAVWPKGDFLVSDSDYVEALTEIDIQTPIPEVVRQIRAGRGFVFFGCRFYDQMLRTYARQILKRSEGPHYAILPPDAELTRNEEKFLLEMGITAIGISLDVATDRLIAA
ncbi:MAG: SIR2 family NAD-dependent protein deacylase [Rhodospirillaceae bacterium]